VGTEAAAAAVDEIDALFLAMLDRPGTSSQSPSPMPAKSRAPCRRRSCPMPETQR